MFAKIRSPLFIILLGLLLGLTLAQETTSAVESNPGSPSPSLTNTSITDGEPSETLASSTASDGPDNTTTGTSSSLSTGDLSPPDVHLKLDVDNLQADINLHANIARLVELNTGIHVSVEKVNITITDVEAELKLVVRLGHLVEIVNRTLASIDLNPALVNLLDSVTDLVGSVVGAGDGGRLNFLINNLGNIVQEVVGVSSDAVSTIERKLDGGLIEKTFSYQPLNALVNIMFNSLNQIVQATVMRGGGSGDDDDDGGETATSSAAPSASNF
ncbi:hypothetical protein F5X68DRAFT_271920 [Plectosphaerella plurivora]|uniref:Uncharacterized protein n=1 Tax=Plectosphaerella plurivora TaxID=936078 RepID=A0A9P8UUZ4_9PEZI|nr:hypothetical protein F5X68DRAFT_271920 [Plectosphaerella plurivora]